MRKRGGEDSGENERHEEYAGRYDTCCWYDYVNGNFIIVEQDIMVNCCQMLLDFS